MKICNKCKLPKENEEFYKNSHSSDGLKSICKICVKLQVKEAREENPERFKEYFRKSFEKNKDEIRRKNREWFRNNPEAKKKNRIRPYNITQEQLEELLKFSGYKCNICGISQKEHFEKSKKDLHIDHCHKTQKVRGLLCHNCNLAIGYMNDNIELLDKAKEYLKIWQQLEN